MRVEDVMSTQVRTCRPQDTLEAAARLLWDRDCGSVPIVDESSRVVGILTDRDICMAAYFHGQPLYTIPVSEVMTREVFTCKADDLLPQAVKILQERQVRRLPVVDPEGRLVGLLSLADLAQEAAAERGQKKRDVVDTEIGEVLAKITAPRVSEEKPTRIAILA